MLHDIAATVTAVFDALRVLVPDLILGRLLYGLGRFLLLSRQAKRHYPAALWGRFRHRWLMRNLGLAYLDEHRKTVKPIPLGTSHSVALAGKPRSRLRFPPASYRADPYGLVVRLRTIPKVGADEIEANAAYLADALNAVRVSITQARPGRVEVRAFRRDPLCEQLPASVLPTFDGRHVILGRDEHGTTRRASLANHAGSCWAGNPGRGKTESALSLAVQLGASPLVDLHVLDGGGCDWAHFADGAAGYVADDLAAAADMLAGLDATMRVRRRSLEADLGVRNAWRVGPTPEYRLQWVLVEECPFYLSLDAVKGDRKREQLVATCRGLLAGLLMRGRAPMFHTSLVAQKPTTTSLPSQIRDLCGLRWCFGVSTTDTAVAALGEDIRQYETLSPVQLQDDGHVGVASALLATGNTPFTLLRFPAVGEELADRTAFELTNRRQLAPKLSAIEAGAAA